MSNAPQFTSCIPELGLRADGGISVRGASFDQASEVFETLPDDWAVHKPAGNGEILRCKRGDGTIKRFLFLNGRWQDLDRNEEVISLVAAPAPSPAANPIREAYRQHCSLQKGECFWGTRPRPHTEITFLDNGRVLLGNRTFSSNEPIEGYAWGMSRAYRAPGSSSILIVEELSSPQLFLFDVSFGWFQLSRAKRPENLSLADGGCLEKLILIVVLGVVTFGLGAVALAVYYAYMGAAVKEETAVVCLADVPTALEAHVHAFGVRTRLLSKYLPPGIG
jgi:hypothetical protein